ncbi:hypothetical protein CLIB1423_13S00650 [[Candida] railenensis]|uniref:[acyl-carrier-protein] S-malonyltransferase n=1 Tax=[Candida] railenensis TaxID=45579 RepID=A0A9P0QT29_9ASCO|nr:hypothetical protein CLIB1423_13S00650 [[Candida] railenensis]
MVSARPFAITFPGQGIKKPGLLSPYRQLKSTLIKDELDVVSDVMGPEFTETLLESEKVAEEGWIKKTSNAQPAVLATSYIINQIMKKQFNVDLVSHPGAKYILGHSLGEYSAHLVNGSFSFPLALRLVSERATIMEQLVQQRGSKFSMKAVLFDATRFDELVEEFAEQGILANVNASNQLVISGEESEIIEIINANKSKIKRALPLYVNVPFHSKILDGVEPKLREFLTERMDTESFTGQLPVVSNLTGLPSKGEESLSNTLAANSKPVQWVKSMQFLASDGVADVINVGPGSVVSGLNSRYNVKNHNLETLQQMETLANYLEKKCGSEENS